MNSAANIAAITRQINTSTTNQTENNNNSIPSETQLNRRTVASEHRNGQDQEFLLLWHQIAWYMYIMNIIILYAMVALIVWWLMGLFLVLIQLNILMSLLSFFVGYLLRKSIEYLDNRHARNTHLGSTPSEAECKANEPCTICFNGFRSPIKLKCGHIFCSQCIRTWLAHANTCPYCRAMVTGGQRRGAQ